MILTTLQLPKTRTTRIRREAIFWSRFCRLVVWRFLKPESWELRCLSTISWKGVIEILVENCPSVKSVFSKSTHVCVTCVYKSYGRKTTRLHFLPFLKTQWCFLTTLTTLMVRKSLKLRTARREKGTSTCKNEIFLRNGLVWSEFKWSKVSVHCPYRQRWRKMWKNENKWGTVS